MNSTHLSDQPDLNQTLKSQMRQFYEGINQELNSNGLGEYSLFLNYGYASDNSPEYAQVEVPKHSLKKNSIKLILELIGDCNLTGYEVLDVGCGRGGNALTIEQQFPVKQVTGIDLSGTAISFCQTNFHGEKLRFLEGDAENLPFPDSSFDAVVNIESSHAYPNIYKFYAGVSRVLKQQGYFLYTDALPHDEIENYVNFLQKLGFELELERDITPNVLLSLDESAIRYKEAFETNPDGVNISNFLALPGSDIYEALKKRQVLYKIFRFKKVAQNWVDLSDIETTLNPNVMSFFDKQDQHQALGERVQSRASQQKKALSQQKQLRQQRRKIND